MRAAFILSALAVFSTVAAGNLRRQEEVLSESDDSESATQLEDSSSTAPDADATTTASSAATSGTPVADLCLDVCAKASTIYSTCHDQSDSLLCFCTPDNINGLGDCLNCEQSIETDDGKTEADPLQESIGGIIQACIASASTSVSPTKATITASASASAIPASQITAPPAARITGNGSNIASATATNTTSTSSASKSGASASASGGASTSNGASKLDMSFMGVLVGALALFV